MALSIRRELPSGIILPDAYAWMSGLSIDLRNGIAQVTIDLHPSINDWQRPPAEQIQVVLDEAGAGESPMPTLSVMMRDPEFAAAYETLGEKLYVALATYHPIFIGAKQA